MNRERDVGVGPRSIVQVAGKCAQPTYSFCCMVTDWEQYDACRASLRTGGFDYDHCEFLVVDNSDGNIADAYESVNEFLQVARADHIVLHHHDVLLLDDGRDVLGARLAQLTDVDPYWAVCGNAGVTGEDVPVLCISHPQGDAEICGGPFPARVVSLDENLLVVRRLANLAVSRDLAGFHHYAADLCLVADVLGWHAYVIDFHLRHLSAGTLDERYDVSARTFAEKYRRAFRSRWLHLITRRDVFVSGSRLEESVARVTRSAAERTRVTRHRLRRSIRAR